MTKNTLIRNDSPHEVKVREGSNVAEHRGPKIKGEREPALPDFSADPVMDIPAEEVQPTTKVKKRAPAKTRAKPRLTPQAGILPPGLNTAPPPPPPAEPTLPMLPLIEAEALWEQDNPVKERLTALRTRNAVLTEQIQRLQQPLKARGK